ncbi:glycosyltransferase family 4 protein [Streptomyces sp. NPDC050738]|uniref:glycosyltransferase family 4 protein n=1 Tax=Streptomyces sp. NPDC050738 TaxID=3154744 RepID=UPI00344105A6
MSPQQHPDARGFAVLHVVQPGEGGVARVVLDLIAAQIDQGFRVLLACPPSTSLAEAAVELGCVVSEWPAVRSPARHVIRECRQLARLISALGPDVVHAHSAKAGLVARIVVRGRIPTIYQPHAWSFEAVDSGTSTLALWWERWAARWATRVVCVSKAEQRRGHQAGIRAEYSVVRNGVDVQRFTPDTDSVRARSELAELESWPASALSVVCVGRLCMQKGQDVLLQAWSAVVARFPDARLVLVGDGPDGEALRRAALPSVTFVGAVKDTAAWYRAADLVVLPSRWEGIAVAPLEAMATGRAVVVTDVDGAREGLPPGHHPVSLVPPDDPEALASAVISMLGQPVLRVMLGEQASQHVRSHFDVRRVSAAMAEIYRDVALGQHHEFREPVSP